MRRNGEGEKMERCYAAIDLKSFFASVECVERGLDPMRTNLVVADEERTEKTICLAVTPPLKAMGVPGRPRLFEVVQRVRTINAERRRRAPGKVFIKSSFDSEGLKDPATDVCYFVARPRMALYQAYSLRIYEIYLKYLAPEDMHVYSVDEVFFDLTGYLSLYRMTAHDLVRTMIREVYRTTGITATAGIGTNLYLCKVAMDIVAKKAPADADGVRIAELDERRYRELLWDHTPITDFWRVGRGFAKRLASVRLYTMGDVARCSLGGERDYYNEDLLYKLFGIHAELLIDHAWGVEPVEMKHIKAYRPESHSLCSGQVLSEPSSSERARLIVREMADGLALDLVERGAVCDQVVLTVGYDAENLRDPARAAKYRGEVTTDFYGRKIPKHAHGTENLRHFSSSCRELTEAATALFDRIINAEFTVRRLTLTANHVIREEEIPTPKEKQLDFFTSAETLEAERRERESVEKERKVQRTVLRLKQKYGKNAVLRGNNFMEGATARERNSQIGGHRA